MKRVGFGSSEDAALLSVAEQDPQCRDAIDTLVSGAPLQERRSDAEDILLLDGMWKYDGIMRRRSEFGHLDDRKRTMVSGVPRIHGNTPLVDHFARVIAAREYQSYGFVTEALDTVTFDIRHEVTQAPRDASKTAARQVIPFQSVTNSFYVKTRAMTRAHTQLRTT